MEKNNFKKQKDGSYKCNGCGLTFKTESLDKLKEELNNWKEEKIEVKDE